MEDYKPFITKGFVSPIGDETSLQPIKILHDTEASQTVRKYLTFIRENFAWCKCVVTWGRPNVS
jgi:hypothetical protein